MIPPVLHLAAGNLFGGVETFLVTLADSRDLCPEPAHELATSFDDRLAGELRARGAAVHVLGAVQVRRPWTIRTGRRALARVLAAKRYALAITHGCWPHAVFGAAVRRAGVPLAFFAHDVLRGKHWVERWARLTRPDLVLANSDFTAPGAHGLFPGVPCRVYRTPVAAPALDRAATRARIRGELGAPDDAVVIACASRLERWKGHELLLDALSLVPDRRWVAWIAGAAQRPHEAAYLASLEERTRALGLASRVKFLGHRTDVPALLAAADVHCQPNVAPEPFGRVFVEALLAGLPVVTTALGGALEIVDSSVGRLVAPEAAAVAAALERLIAHPEERTRLGAAGPERARALCDPRARLEELRDLVAAVVPEPAGAARA